MPQPVVLYPSYFAPVIHYAAMARAGTVLFEVDDNFQKQTYRNRCYIYGANGSLMLNVPLRHKNHSRKTRDMRIDYSTDWRKLHLKSLQAAYRASPYYEFYEDEIDAIFRQKFDYLLDLNLYILERMFQLLNMDIPYSKSDVYQEQYDGFTDLRCLINAKSGKVYGLQPYIQVFSSKMGFIENLSILDLLFMEGPHAMEYLIRQQLEFNF